MTHNHKLDNIRALAILAVVFGHSIILYSSGWDIYETAQSSALLDWIKRGINLFQMPLFFSLSGYLLSLGGSRKSFVPFAKNKLQRLMVPFLLVGIFFMIPLKTLLGCPGYENESFFLSVLRLVLGKELGHLWYLPSLLLMNLPGYWIIRWENRRSGVLAVCFLGSVALYVLRSRLIFLRLPYLFDTATYLWSFLLGAVIHRYALETRLARLRFPIAGITLALSLYSLIRGQADLVTAAAITLSFYLLMPGREAKLLRELSIDSFGLYLFHSPLIYITFTFLSEAPPSAVVGINFLLWGALALGLTRLLRKTPLKILIGEG